MPEEDEVNKPSIQADNKSVVFNNISTGGSIGNINVNTGDTRVYQYASEDAVPLTSTELETGLIRFAEYLPDRAPVLQEKFAIHAKKLRATFGPDLNALSPTLKTQREDAVNNMKLLCMEALDISFRALCTGQNPPPYDSRPPFRGLFAFRPEDKDFYFGRELLIQKLIERLQAHPFLAVLGASGSGKSSLVMAGLIPALEAQMAYLTPSTNPLSRLQEAQEKADQKAVFVVDQFEELFTLTRDASEREAFIKELLVLSKSNRVVVTMRADFWGEVASHPDLRAEMQAHQELIGPMDADELRSAVEKQADAVGLRFDPTLSENILDDVQGEPGAMPLLQHALWLLWKRRHGFYLKADEYHAFGGVKQAIASTAEEMYASCSDFEQARVRDIFLRLTRLDDSSEGRDTRRRASIKDLLPANTDPENTTNLLNKLADARLIVKSASEVEVAHEALIRHWSRLTGWLNDDRDNLRLRESVSEAASEWDVHGRDESLLNHRGGRLELALAMSQNPRYQLNPTEQAYLSVCVELRERARIEKEAQQQRALEAAKKLAETAQAQAQAERRARLITNGVLVAAIILVGVLSYNPIRNELWRREAMKSEMISIPAGDYLLGDQQRTEEYPDDYLVYQKYSVAAFSIDSYPVTNKRYVFCIQAGICSRPDSLTTEYKDERNADKPVVNITSIDAAEFCNWIGLLLPSDKEWEVAASQISNILPTPDSRYSAEYFFEWTRSPYDQDRSEWTDLSKDPPELLTQKGGFLDEPIEKTMTLRRASTSTGPESTTGFRCVINH